MQYDEYITSRLSQEEIICAFFASQGLTNKEIAKEINYSPYAVKYRLAKAYKKLKVINRNNLAYVMANHIITKDTEV